MAHVVVMGVSGCGKSVLGQALAMALERPFIEGDMQHPPGNRAKMAAGEALTDQDRAPFLANVAARLAEAPDGAVASCSALRRGYRDAIRRGAGPVLFVLPHLDRAELERRLTMREGHFMPASLLDSQLATLEPPQPDEWAIVLDGQSPVAALVAQARDAFVAGRD